MNYRLMTLLVLLTFAFSYQYSFGQLLNVIDWTEEDCESFFWGDENEGVSITESAEKWNDEPAVILYKQRILEHKIRGGKKFDMSFANRYRVKIQNNAALQNFSTLSFSKGPSGYFYNLSEYFGLKIIKPSGEEIVINVKEEWEEKERKLAVANLAVGDIIDYWSFYSHSISSIYLMDIDQNKYVFWGNMDEYFDYYFFTDGYPVNKGKFELYFDDNQKIYFKALNEETKVVKNTKGEINSLSVEFGDYDGRENLNWYSSFVNDDAIKYYVIPDKGYQNQYRKQGRVQVLEKFPDAQIKERYLKYLVDEAKSATNEFNSSNKMLAKRGNENPSNEEVMEHYFYFIKHKFLNGDFFKRIYRDISPREMSELFFFSHLTLGTDKLKQDVELYIVSPSNYSKIDNVFHVEEMYLMLKMKSGDGIYFFLPDGKSTFNNMPASVEGTQAYKIVATGEKMKTASLLDVVIPVSKHTDNVNAVILDIELNPEDFKILDVKGNINCIGHSKNSYVANLIDYYDFVLDDAAFFNMSDFGNLKNEEDKEVVVQLTSYKEEANTERNEYMIDELQRTFDTEVEEVELEVISDGASLSDEDFEVSYNFELNDHIKKVGPNYLIEVGHLIGGQVEIEEKERERTVDINMPYARTFTNEINITIPDGYVVEGLEELNFNVDNESGGFISSAELIGNKLVVKTKKMYKKKVEKAKNWPLMLEFIDAAQKFYNLNVLMKKG
ncbi:MAG: hypothetical protein GY751_08400 [Bacteroidetes bacterium]|nr:hypothetical protein [Bacteroidota bacterium]